MSDKWEPNFTPWRHGGWYVTNIHHPNGGCGCVSNNYPDKKWRIACYPTYIPFEDHPTFKTRDAAARAEREWVSGLLLTEAAPEMLEALEGLLKELHDTIKLDVKKHYSLMVADSIARKAIAKAKGEI